MKIPRRKLLEPAGSESPPAPALDTPHDTRLARLLQDYLDRESSGSRTDLEDFLAERPDASELRHELAVLSEFSAAIGEEPHLQALGDFELLDEIGRGAMGIVYKARQVSLDRRVALKVLPLTFAVDSKYLARFQREAKVAASLNHANIVSVFAMGVDQGVPYFAMEYAEGLTLREMLARSEEVLAGKHASFDAAVQALADCLLESEHREEDRGSAGPVGEAPAKALHAGAARRQGPELHRRLAAKLAELFAGAADGLHHAHSRQVIHRDIKPSNLIVDRRGRLRVLDFGVARAAGQESLTGTLDRVGTPLYMSPEQARGDSAAVGPGTDVYSLGATLYEVIALKPPFQGGSTAEVLRRIERDDPPSLRGVNPHVPHDLEMIVLRCLEKSPRDRYATAEALAQDLRRFARGDPVEARPRPLYQRFLRRGWRRRRGLSELLGCAALLVALLVLGLGYLRNARLHRDQEYQRLIEESLGQLLGASILSSDPEPSWSAGEIDTVRSDEREGHRPDALERSFPDVFLRRAASGLFTQARRDHIDRAVEGLREAVALIPELAAGRYHLARALLVAGRRAEAEAQLEAALRLEPDFVPGLALRLAVFEAMARPEAESAQSAFDRAVRHPHRRRQEAWLDVHRALLSERWSDAAAALDRLQHARAGERYAGFALEVRLGRGIAHLNAGSHVRALDAFAWAEEALRRAEPSLLKAKTYVLIANTDEAARIIEELHTNAALEGPTAAGSVARAAAELYSNLGRFQDALVWCSRTPEGPERFMLEAELHARLEDFEAAQRSAHAAHEVWPSTETLITLGDVDMARGELTAAETWYRRALNGDVRDAGLLLALALAVERQGRLNEAQDALDAALDLDAENGQLHASLARVYYKTGRLTEAVAHGEKAVHLRPGDALAANDLGISYDREGRLEDARRQYERAIELRPTFAAAHYNLGWRLQREMRFEDAEASYRRALRFGLDHALVYCHLGTCLHHLGDLDGAFVHYEASLERDPTLPLTHFYLAAARRPSDPEGARDEYRKAVALSPNWFEARWRLAWVLGDMAMHGNDRALLEESLDAYEAAMALDDSHPWVHGLRAELLLWAREPLPDLDTLRGEVRRLEDSLRRSAEGLGRKMMYTHQLLGDYRTELSPDVASFASIDAIVAAPRPVIPEGSAWEYAAADEVAAAADWTSPEPQGGEPWAAGAAPFGYPEGETIVDGLRGRCASLWVRKRFSLVDAAAIDSLILKVRVDDGFIAYLNGREVARHNAGVPEEDLGPGAVAGGEKGESWRIRSYRVPLHIAENRPDDACPERAFVLRSENVLAVRGVNRAPDDDDFLLDVALYAQGRPRRADVDAARVEFLAVHVGREGGIRLLDAYFEAWSLEIDGQLQDAAAAFASVARQAERPEPYLRAAACLVRTGDLVRARSIVREALDSGLLGDRQLWNEWVRLEFLARIDPAEILASLPVERDRGSPRRGPLDNVRWLLDHVVAGRGIWINCGGTTYEASGTTWEKDRFYCGGEALFLKELANTHPKLQDASLYFNERWFPEGAVARERLKGYELPLPPGSYRVTLHFVEGYHRDHERRFHVFLEDECFLVDYRPRFGKPEPHSREVAVRDGALNIDFLHVQDNPKLSALEILPLVK